MCAVRYLQHPDGVISGTDAAASIEKQRREASSFASLAPGRCAFQFERPLFSPRITVSDKVKMIRSKVEMIGKVRLMRVGPPKPYLLLVFLKSVFIPDYNDDMIESMLIKMEKKAFLRRVL
ncbi:hypothetical protein TcasGA2_TC004795 [Tribolium castaneum]|uniref:Uncharacterized protein n=1 Tax=Tribolium castaneum TaxID=7070 RepID=D6W856_TRICA|nr:hypothetical protein TcasGA2_TC004795 [Tribolium castaneum]